MAIQGPSPTRRRTRGVIATGAVAALVVQRSRRTRTPNPGLHLVDQLPPQDDSTFVDEEASISPAAEPGPERSRWSILLGYGLLAAATQALLVNYAPVTGDAARHFDVSITTVGWLSQVFPLVYVVLAIPAGIALDRFFHASLIGGAVLTVVGAFVRLLADDYQWALIGQVVAAAGQPFVLNAITGLAVRYLARRHQATGIAVASAATFAGMVVGYLLGALLPGENHIRTLTLITAFIALDAALCLFAALHFTPAQSHLAAGRGGESGIHTFRTAWRSRHLRRLCLVVAVPMGTFIALATYVQPLLEPAGVSESSAGLILAAALVAGVVGCAIVPVWAARRNREVQFMGVGIAFTSVACLHLALVPSTTMAALTLMGVGCVLLPALPIVLSLSEQHVPHAESTAAGLVWLAGNLGGVVVATVVGLLVTRPVEAFVSLAFMTLLALPALRFFEALDYRQQESDAEITG